MSAYKEKKGVPKSAGFDADCLKAGIKQESREHSWLTPAQAERIAKDHLRRDPAYYEEDEPKGEKPDADDKEEEEEGED